MSTYLSLAKEYIKKIAPDCDIVSESILDLADLFCFTYQSKLYLRSRNNSNLLIGQGMNFIYKKDNRIFSYGSASNQEKAIDDIRQKLKIEEEIRVIIKDFDLLKHYDLTITKINSIPRLIENLLKYEINYIIPEIVGDSIFRIAKPYKRKMLNEKLSKLPLTFHGINPIQFIPLVHDLIQIQVCEFEIKEHFEVQHSKYLSRASAKDLEPIW